jgi:O-antigen ligase
MASNFLVGAGFESFWLGPRLQAVWDAFPNLYVSEAHNGYIEVYLNLGVVGLAAILGVLIHGYRRSVAAFRVNPDLGSLMLAYVLTAAIYSYTEAGFRMLDFAWISLLLAIIGASRIVKLAEKSAPVLPAPSDSVWWTGVETTSDLANR